MGTPKTFIDFSSNYPGGNIDGMRCDKNGTLFLSRNGGQMVMKVTRDGQLDEIIRLTGFITSTNLEFGGPNGKTLTMVGSCQGRGCVATWEAPFPGRAFTNLHL